MEFNWFLGKENFEDARLVREEVFVKEQNVPLQIELDGYDDSAYHLIIYKDTRPIGVGRLLKKEGYYIIGRVAVLKEFRGKHYGNVLMNCLINKAKELGATEIKLHAQLYAENFYKKLGFKGYGEVFTEAGIEHICMNKYL